MSLRPSQRLRSALASVPAVQIKPEAIIMNGGLDVMTPPFQMKPGMMRTCQNFECSIYGGYRRVGGYERYDGRAKPSDATYTILAASSITGGAVGNTLHGATSAATGAIIAVTATYFVLTATTGTFQSGENLNVGAGTIAVASADPIIGGASTNKLNAQYKNLAADVYRALIGAIPGSGKTLGVVWYNDVLYGFRNNAGGTAAAIYKSSATGWQAVTLYNEISFTAGGAAIPAEGSTLTQGGVTATLKRAVLTGGTWPGSTASGRLIITNPAGGNFAAGAATLTGGVTLTLSAIQTAITILPDGRYEFVVENFGGGTDTRRIYGCDGANRGFEFDGAVYVPISTGMAIDTPQHIYFHLYHLFFSFFGSAQHSSTGFPYQWSVITGAGELAMGDTITGFMGQPAGTTAAALAIFTAGKLSILYGTGAANWTLLPYRDKIGAFPYTMQNLAQTMFLDLQGVTDLQTAINFGNFVYAVLSNQVKTLLAGWRNGVIASTVSRDLSQYRLFFTNNYGLYFAMVGKKVIGITPVLFPDIVRCTFADYDSDHNEVSFFGTDDGYVMQMDKGTSFDGDDIEAFFDLSYNFSHGARTLKGYKDGVLEVSGNGYSEFNFGYSLGYGSPNVIQPSAELIIANFSSTLWDAFTWDAFIWDGITLGPSTVELGGEAENISFAVRSIGDYYESFTITGGLMHYSPRREMR